MEGIDNIHRFALAIRSANSDTSEVLKKVFSRLHVACFPKNDVTFLLNQSMLAINYWLAKREEKSTDTSRVAIDRLRVFIEVLARASVRASPEQAKQIFRLAVLLSKKPELHHFWLFDAIKHLSEFSLKSIPHSQQYDVLLDALLFPLQSEISIGYHKEWANPVIKHPGERKQNSALDRRIDEIIDHIEPCSPQSAPALLRLLPLIEKSFLTGEELNKIVQKVWGSESDLNNLPETGLLKYVLLKIPSPDPSVVKTLVRRYLFEAKTPNLLNCALLADIANAAKAQNIKEFPSADQAADYFEQLVVWRPDKGSSDPFGFSKNEEYQRAKLVGEVLARSVVAALPSEVLVEENFQKLCAFYSEVEAPETLIAFPYFAIKNEIFNEQVEKLIRQGLQSEDANKLACASYALLIWRDQKESTAIDRLILRLVYLIGSNRMTGLSALLWTANQMYCKKYLSDESIESLVEILPIIFDGAGYGNISPFGRESVSVSLMRAACVRLARDIVNNAEHKNDELLRILKEAKQDALPEVRFAEMENL